MYLQKIMTEKYLDIQNDVENNLFQNYINIVLKYFIITKSYDFAIRYT